MTKGESCHFPWIVNADVSLPAPKNTQGSDPISPENPLPTSSEKLPVPESMSSPPPPAFKTWVPDGSLRFINPDFLSSAEKQTLEQQVQVQGKASVGKRKECEEGSTNNEDKGEKAVNKENGDGVGNGNGNEERPKKMGRPLLVQDEDLLGPPPLATMSSPLGRPSTFPSSLQRRHSRPSAGNIPDQPNEMDLLRQVKSNNLSIPTSSHEPNLNRYLNWVPSGNYSQDRVQYNHIHNQHRQHVHHQQSHQNQSQHRVQTPQQNKQNDLFTYKPLYHPPNPSPNSYTYYPEQTPPNRRSSTSSTDIHPRDRNFSPLPAPATSACASDSPPLTELPPGEAGPLAMNLPHGDWRRKYVGRGRGQSGG
jgi:hypothetical protein